MPTSVTFETLDTCGAGNPLTFSLNGVTIGTMASNGTCICTPPIDTTTISGTPLIDNFNLNLNASNTWGYSAAPNIYTAWNRATVHYADGTTQSACLADKTGTNCTTTYLCDGYAYGVTGSALLPWASTVVTSQAYSDSILPVSLDTSAIAPGDYLLYADASDGTSTVYDTEPLTLAGEPLLWINDTIAPTVDIFTATTPINSLNIPITAFTASDAVGVTGYLITESATPPAAGAAGWTGTAPVTYTVASDGTYTLYPWAKDGVGNVSAVFATPATVLVDTTAPTVDTFTATTPINSLNIPITAFTASDAVGVTGYLITESTTPPAVGDAGWSGTIPATYTVASDGTYTLYPWAKDAEGNVSAVFATPATVVVDTTAPTVATFTATSPSNSLNVPITAFTASDAIGVTGYLITESATPPASGDAGWSGTAPVTYTVANPGTHTLYPWAKDAAGNVSAVFATPASVIVNANIEVMIAGVSRGTYNLPSGGSTRESYASVNDGPVKVIDTEGTPILAAQRILYTGYGTHPTSFVEMMGLPDGQLDTTYWFPWYKNAGEVDTQLRIGNVSTSTATVHIYVAGVEVTGSPFTLTTTGAGQSQRLSFALNDGPVKIVSDQKIVATERLIYFNGGGPTSFSEMMGLPNSQLSTTYWFPWYKNAGEVDTQLRIGNVSPSDATVHIYIAGVEVAGSPFTLTTTGAGQSQRLNFAGVNDGPVKIVSDRNIVASQRILYYAGGLPTSFVETMGIPDGQLGKTQWFPWYKNDGIVDTQLRIGNVSGTTATVHVYIAGVEVTGSPFTLTATGAGQSQRLSFPGMNNGAVKIVSDQNVIASERLIYFLSGVPISFSEMMGTPDSLLSPTYWLPWYKNVGEIDTQLRFGTP